MFFACVVCKATHCLLRLFGFGATSLPGALALKICPDVLSWAAENVRIIAVTGTNGKTTSSRLVEKALINAGESVCANRSGANLMPGITAQLILNKTLFGKTKCDWAVLECDEAACRKTLGRIRPRVLLVTNLFRDQLDRYGEVKYPRDCIADGLKSSPDTVAVINADCPMAASISDGITNSVVWFGADCGKGSNVGSGEDDICPLCGLKMHYAAVSYANLGNYKCSCGFERQRVQFCITDTFSDGSIVLKTPAGGDICTPALPGMYNAYNAAGAVAAVMTAGVPKKAALDAAADFDCGFGRMENFPLGRKGARMILIKNAAAADQTLEQVRVFPEAKTIVLAINDRTADGTDLGWLDDADFGKLRRAGELKNVYVCGDRADAAAKRLERENICCQSVKNYDKLIQILRGEDAFIFILPTYTAMLELRKKLVSALGGKNFWE